MRPFFILAIFREALPLPAGPVISIFAPLEASHYMEPYIVYVDDDPDDLMVIGDTLRSINPSIRVLTFTDGRKALDFLNSIGGGEHMPSLLILDLNMPHVTGFEFLDAVAANTSQRDIPVYIFTNSDHPQHRELSMAKGAVGFATKPYGQSEMEKICAVFAAYAERPVRTKV